MIQRQDFNSSLVQNGSYNSQNLDLILEVNGVEYLYEGVPASVWDGLVQAPSKGVYFNTHIKGVYNFKSLEVVSL